MIKKPEPYTDWLREEVIELCIAIEAICPKYGCHVALTGGLLYKEHPRKDADILFYRIRQAPEIKIEALFDALKTIDIIRGEGSGWCIKAKYRGKPIDFFFPEEEGGDYQET